MTYPNFSDVIRVQMHRLGLLQGFHDTGAELQNRETMTSLLPISVFIIARNESERLGRTLQAIAGLVDDLVVIDSGSTDDTVAVAERAGARVIVNTPFPGYGPQKRFAEDACRNDWVLNIDADEVVSAHLREEIVQLFGTSRDLADAYFIRIIDMLPGETAPPPLAYSVSPVRLYRLSRGRYRNSTVHDRVVLEAGARTKHLSGPILHYSITSLGEQMEKLQRYSTLQAADLLAAGRVPSRLRIVVEFPLSFLKAYIGRRYALRGVYGYLVALNYAYYRSLRLAKAYEAARRT
jgi:glycosyltransferase involved in cell wall biosynthesis